MYLRSNTARLDRRMRLVCDERRSIYRSMLPSALVGARRIYNSCVLNILRALTGAPRPTDETSL